MFYKEFNTFHGLLRGWVRRILKHPETLSYYNGFLGYMEDVVLKCNGFENDIDLAAFGYAKNKWSQLMRVYIDYESLTVFKERLSSASGLSLTYYFKQKKVNNGSCLIGVVLTRSNRKGPWERAKVLYRTTEIQRRFAADLVLISVFLKELPECCAINEVYFYFPQSYISGMVINGYLEMFDVGEEELDSSNGWIKNLLNQRDHYFREDSVINSYQSLAKMQRLKLNGPITSEKLTVDTLSIVEYFEQQAKKKRRK